MGILIPSYTYEPSGLQLSNVYASTFGTEYRIRKDHTNNFVMSFTYFLWTSLDNRRNKKTYIGGVSKYVPYDQSIPLMTQVYNVIKADFTDTIDIITDPEPVSETV